MTRELDYDTIGFIMSLEQAKLDLEQAGRPGDAALAKRLQVRIDKYGDISPESNQATGQSTALAPLSPAVAAQAIIPFGEGRQIRPFEYAFVEPTVDGQHNLLTWYWNQVIERLNKDKVEIPRPTFSLDQLRLSRANGLFWFYLPEQYASAEALLELVAALPFAQGPYTYDQGAYPYQGKLVKNISEFNSWGTIEWQAKPPFTNTTERRSDLGIWRMGRVAQTLNLFIAASGLHKVLTNRFLDEGTYSRLFSTLIDGEPAVVTSRTETGLIVVKKASEIGDGADPQVGARTVGLTAKYGRDLEELKTEYKPALELAEGLSGVDRKLGDALWNKTLGKIKGQRRSR